MRTWLRLGALCLLLLAVGFALGRGSSRCCSPDASPVPVATPPSAPGSSPPSPPASGEAQAVLAAANPRDSLVYMPFNSFSNESPEAVRAARILVRSIETGDATALGDAAALYRALIPMENFGGEYPTLLWFCEYQLASDKERKRMEKSPEGRRFVEFFGRDRWAPLHDWLMAKYGFSRSRDMDRMRAWDEIIRFNSPHRYEWEKTSELLRLLDLKPGQRVADVGSGAGFFTFRMAEAVGATGNVLSVEMNPLHVEYVRSVAQAEGLSQITVQSTEGPFPQVPPGSLDRVLLCSTYQALYLFTRPAERDAWVASLKASLKDDGLVVVSENDPVIPEGYPPYRGISVSRPLIKAQLLTYGFQVVEDVSYVPQRYVLVLRKAPGV